MVMTVNFESPPYMSTGVAGRQNSRINCLHMPHGLAGGVVSVLTAIARMSPLRRP